MKPYRRITGPSRAAFYDRRFGQSTITRYSSCRLIEEGPPLDQSHDCD